MKDIPDFTDRELWTIESTLAERYGEPVKPELAESEMRLNPHATELTPCPIAYWEHRGCHFVIAKVGIGEYRCQFFYRIHQMYGPDVDVFDDITECAVTLLQVQADHEAVRQAATGEN